MIEILDPRTINPSPLVYKISGGWHYPLDYSWIFAQLRDFTVPEGTRILDVGSLFSELSNVLESWGYCVETMDRTPDGIHHHKGDFLEYEFGGVDKFDVILWSSSIEHQEDFEDIRRCYLKSWDMLGPGGIFIATFPIAIQTKWFPQAFQWNISKQDAMRTFDENVIRGNYKKIWSAYRENIHNLRDRYVERFQQWDIDDPAYLAGAVVKVK